MHFIIATKGIFHVLAAADVCALRVPLFIYAFYFRPVHKAITGECVGCLLGGPIPVR